MNKYQVIMENGAKIDVFANGFTYAWMMINARVDGRITKIKLIKEDV